MKKPSGLRLALTWTAACTLGPHRSPNTAPSRRRLRNPGTSVPALLKTHLLLEPRSHLLPCTSTMHEHWLYHVSSSGAA